MLSLRAHHYYYYANQDNQELVGLPVVLARAIPHGRSIRHELDDTRLRAYVKKELDNMNGYGEDGLRQFIPATGVEAAHMRVRLVLPSAANEAESTHVMECAILVTTYEAITVWGHRGPASECRKGSRVLTKIFGPQAAAYISDGSSRQPATTDAAFVEAANRILHRHYAVLARVMAAKFNRVIECSIAFGGCTSRRSPFEQPGFGQASRSHLEEIGPGEIMQPQFPRAASQVAAKLVEYEGARIRRELLGNCGKLFDDVNNVLAAVKSSSEQQVRERVVELGSTRTENVTVSSDTNPYGRTQSRDGDNSI